VIAMMFQDRAHSDGTLGKMGSIHTMRDHLAVEEAMKRAAGRDRADPTLAR